MSDYEGDLYDTCQFCGERMDRSSRADHELCFLGRHHRSEFHDPEEVVCRVCDALVPLDLKDLCRECDENQHDAVLNPRTKPLCYYYD